MSEILTSIICYFSNHLFGEAEAILWKEGKEHRNVESEAQRLSVWLGNKAASHFA